MAWHKTEFRQKAQKRGKTAKKEEQNFNRNAEQSRGLGTDTDRVGYVLPLLFREQTDKRTDGRTGGERQRMTVRRV